MLTNLVIGILSPFSTTSCNYGRVQGSSSLDAGKAGLELKKEQLEVLNAIHDTFLWQISL